MSDASSNSPKNQHDPGDRSPDRAPGKATGRGNKAERPESDATKHDPKAEPRPEAKANASAASKDITPVLKGWDYEPGTINVRKIAGLDGAPKLQMRQP